MIYSTICSGIESKYITQVFQQQPSMSSKARPNRPTCIKVEVAAWIITAMTAGTQRSNIAVGFEMPVILGQQAVCNTYHERGIENRVNRETRVVFGVILQPLRRCCDGKPGKIR